MPKAKKSSRTATSPAKDLQAMEGQLRRYGYDPDYASRLQTAGWGSESLDHALVDGPEAHGLTLPKAVPAPKEPATAPSRVPSTQSAIVPPTGVAPSKTGKTDKTDKAVKTSDNKAGKTGKADKPASTKSASRTSTSSDVKSPTATSTEVRSPTSTSTEAYTAGNFTATVTGGAGAGATSVSINLPSLPQTNGHAKENPIATNEHPQVIPSIFIVLKTEADQTSRTGVAVCAYYKADGYPLQNLHIGGETEFEARSRVLSLYPHARIELEHADHKEACCASCAMNKPCESGCHKHETVSGTVKRLISYAKSHVGMAGEPLMAVYEDGEEEEVLGCGACSSHGNEAAHPTVLRFEKAQRTSAGGYAFETMYEVPLSSELQQHYSNGACKGSACLPWVRLEKDPQQFRAALQAARKLGPVTKSKVFYELVQDYLVRQDQEVFVILMLDVHMNVRGFSEISRGARDRVLVPIPDVLRLPLVEGATAFVVAHNHPSGKTKPSKADDELTKAIKQGADASEILFVDHLVIGATGYYSYSDHGRL